MAVSTKFAAACRLLTADSSQTACKFISFIRYSIARQQQSRLFAQTIRLVILNSRHNSPVKVCFLFEQNTSISTEASGGSGVLEASDGV
jgi:hypothetical protein